MAYGNLTGYEPGPAPSSYYFAQPNGQKLLMAGDPAEDLKRRIDASAALAPQPTAENTARPPGSYAQMFTGAAPPPQATDAGGAPPAAPAPTGDVPIGGTGYYRNARGQLLKDIAPTAGVSRAQLANKAEQGVAIPVSQQTTTQGGVGDADEYKLSLQENYGREMAAMSTGRKAAEEQALVEKAYNQTQEGLAIAAEKEAQAQAADSARRVTELQTRYDKAAKRYEDFSVNPTRAEVPIFDALAAGFGAFAATLSKTPNFALEVINDRIARDIRAQELEKSKLGEATGNAYSRLESELGSSQLAKTALTGIQQKRAAATFAVAGAAAKDTQRKSLYEGLSAKLGMDYAKSQEQLRREMQGVVTQSKSETIAYPHAGSSGGRVKLSPEESLRVAGSIQNLEKGDLENQGKAVGVAQSEEELAKARRAGGGGEVHGEAGKALQSSGFAMAEMKKQLMKDSLVGGKPWTPEGQNILAKGYRATKDLVAGEGSFKNEDLSPEERARSDRFQSSKQTLLSMGTQLSGAGAPSEGEALRSAVGAAQTEEQLVNIVEQYQPVIEAKLKAYK